MSSRAVDDKWMKSFMANKNEKSSAQINLQMSYLLMILATSLLPSRKKHALRILDTQNARSSSPSPFTDTHSCCVAARRGLEAKEEGKKHETIKSSRENSLGIFF